jgi:hypothetical protein
MPGVIAHYSTIPLSMGFLLRAVRSYITVVGQGLKARAGAYQLRFDLLPCLPARPSFQEPYRSWATRINRRGSFPRHAPQSGQVGRAVVPLVN